MNEPSPPSSPSPTVREGAHAGRLLAGRYRLEDRVASGGMAEVWRATDEVLARQVAVKVLHPHLAADDTFVARFRAEAVAAARLAHPAIVSIYDTCHDDGQQAIVMELVRGRTLRQMLDDSSPLEPATAVTVATSVADALEVAHRAGVVHRDIKPANILLSDDGRVMVADFGIAKAADRRDLTADGTLLGTAKYLSPEQVEGGPVDGRTDLYALGVVLYESLCGRPPFDADSDAATALARLQGDPLRPRQVRASVPRALEEVVLRAMSRRPEDRYATAGDLRAALLATASTAGPVPDLDRTAAVNLDPATPPGGTPTFRQTERSWLVPTLLVVLVATALGVAGVLLGRSGAGQDLFGRARDAVGAGPSIGIATITDAVAFDPIGGDGENDGEAGLTIDGDLDTAWSTSGYDDRDVTLLKDGVGLYVTLERAAALDELVVASPTNDWSASIYIAERPGEDIEAWGEPVTSREGVASGEAAFDLDGARGAAVLIWFTDLGDGPPRTRAELAELEVRARQ
ncbi:hypothetical protein BH20ACT2_BH20ACT2_11930 [soil metagenome]